MSNTAGQASGVLSSAFSGAAGGLAFGPIGAVAGGILGLATGLFGAKAKNDQEAAVKEQEERQRKAAMPIVSATQANSQYGTKMPTLNEDKFGILNRVLANQS